MNSNFIANLSDIHITFVTIQANQIILNFQFSIFN